MKIALTPVDILSLRKQEHVLYEDTWYTDFTLGRSDFFTHSSKVSRTQLKFTNGDEVFVENVGRNPVYLMKPNGFSKLTLKTKITHGDGIYINPICFKVHMKRQDPPPSISGPNDRETEAKLHEAILDDSEEEKDSLRKMPILESSFNSSVG
jgi:hypothetical protein